MNKEKQKTYSIQTIVYSFIIVCVTMAASVLLDVCLKFSLYAIIKHGMLMLLPVVVVCLLYGFERKHKLLDFNECHKNYAFFIVYVLCFFFFIAGGFTNIQVFPFSVVAIPLVLFANASCAYFGYFSIVFFLLLHFQLNTNELCILCFTGFVAITLFSKLDKEFHYAGCCAGYMVSVFVAYGYFFVLSNDNTNQIRLGDTLLNFGILLFVTLLLMLLVLKLFSVVCVYKQSDLFDEINDPEYTLLSQLKEVNKQAYFHAVHTAYLSDKLARKIGADPRMAKAIGYYHKIGLLQGKDNLQNTILVANANELPEELVYELKRYGIKQIDHLSKENAIAQLADAVVTSITYLFGKDKDIVIDYHKVVSVIIQKKLDSHDFDHCQLTVEDLTTIRNGFVEERLYYDFLR